MSEFEYVKKNYEALLSEIRGYEKLYNRRITVVAVTKSGSDEELLSLVKAGASDLAENRPGELKRRAELLRDAGYEPRFHEIGNLQRNKVKLIVNEASLIHSVGRYELAKEISDQALKLGITVPVLIEINSAKEDLKGGVAPENAEDLFLKVRALPAVSVKGLMTMGPAFDNAEDLRPYFRLTKEIFDRINTEHGFDGDGILSMGMSNSYAVAIEEGSTLIRVGRKLFEKNEGR
jgi:pyridoxal phosphate enzyme (YggS family)